MSKTAYVVARLREDISRGRIPSGAALLQTVIAAEYGVSPTPVREALRVLEADGIIEYSDGFGATVRRVSPEEIGEFYRLRSVTEGLATEMAVERMDHGDIDHLERIHASIRELVDGKSIEIESLATMNRSLHFAIYSLGSEVITRHIKNLWTFVPPRITLWRDPEIARQLLGEHEDIMAAIRAGDSTQAGVLTAEHVLHAFELRKQFEMDELSDAGSGRKHS